MDLSDDALLEKCLLGATQNRNESFNSLIWARCPKTGFSGLATIQIAVSHSVIVFNSGKMALTSVLDGLNIDAGPLCLSYLRSQDTMRLKKAEAREKAVAKKKRQSVRREKAVAEEACIEGEGVTYKAGGFD